jgi:ElaB/YqjD/DUF883 family membrane-anchored ribosome-binding protein
MSEAKDEISELMALQREAAEPRSRPRKPDKKTEPAEQGAPPAGDEPISGAESELKKTMQELSENLEIAVQEIEDAAREQPALTALVAFTLGLVVGQLFSRR